MRQVEVLEAFLNKSDKEIIKFARDYGVELSVQEIRSLRPIAQSASVSWLFTGIPNQVLKEAAQIIGEKKLKKLLSYMP